MIFILKKCIYLIFKKIVDFVMSMPQIIDIKPSDLA